MKVICVSLTYENQFFLFFSYLTKRELLWGKLRLVGRVKNRGFFHIFVIPWVPRASCSWDASPWKVFMSCSRGGPFMSCESTSSKYRGWGLLGSIQLLLIHEHSRLIEKDHHDEYIWNYYHTYKSNLVLRNWIFTKMRVTWTAILLMMIIEQSWTFMNFMITFDHVVWCHITTIVKHFLVLSR